jgi:hypothetical protein
VPNTKSRLALQQVAKEAVSSWLAIYTLDNPMKIPRNILRDPNQPSVQPTPVIPGPSIGLRGTLPQRKSGQPIPVIILPNGRLYSQFPSRHGNATFPYKSFSDGPSTSSFTDEKPAFDQPPQTPQSLRFSSPLVYRDSLPEIVNHREQYRRKKINQNHRWQDVTIPDLINIYLEHLAKTTHLMRDVVYDSLCPCGGNGHAVKVLGVYYNRQCQIYVRALVLIVLKALRT